MFYLKFKRFSVRIETQCGSLHLQVKFVSMVTPGDVAVIFKAFSME